MFYAPHVNNADIGASPSLADLASLQYPFIDRKGNDEQSYMIQLVGATEKAAILYAGQSLEDALGEFEHALCLTDDAMVAHGPPKHARAAERAQRSRRLRRDFAERPIQRGLSQRAELAIAGDAGVDRVGTVRGAMCLAAADGGLVALQRLG